MRFVSKKAMQRTRKRRRALFIEQFEQRIVFAAPATTPFPVGNVPLGSSLRIEAADIVSDFGTDVDSILSANSVSFSTASVNGGAARPLTDVGFAYSPGAGVSGALVINTIGASAFAGLASGASASVTIGFRVSDGTSSTPGVFSFTVTNTTRVANTIVLRMLGTANPDQTLIEDFSTTLPAGTSRLQASILGLQDISDGLASFDLREPISTAFNDLFRDGTLTIAAGYAEGMNATSRAQASFLGKAQSIASMGSSATTNATLGGLAKATASQGSSATSTATNASAVSTATNGSVAEATSDETAQTQATAEVNSTAIAFGTRFAVGLATASERSTARAIAVQGARSEAIASFSSDALAFAKDQNSQTRAEARNNSSASSGAEGRSSATSFIRDNSRGVSGATGGSTARVSAQFDSSTLALAAFGSTGAAGATSGSVSQALAFAPSSSVTASADTASAADAVSGHDFVSTGTLAQAIAEITVENAGAATRGRQIAEDMELAASGGVPDDNSIARFIDQIPGRNPTAQLPDYFPRFVRATATNNSLATSVDAIAESDGFKTSRGRSGATTASNFSFSTAASGVVGQGTNLIATSPTTPLVGMPGVPIALPFDFTQLTSDPIDLVEIFSLPSGTVLKAGSQVLDQNFFNSAPPSNLTFTVPTRLGNSSTSFTLGIRFSNGTGNSTTVYRDVRIGTTYSITPIDANKVEGNSGVTPFTFEVKRFGDVNFPSSAVFIVEHATGDDFQGNATPSGPIDFAAGETTKVLTINVNGDQTAELDELLSVRITDVTTNLFIPTIDRAFGLIRNDDRTISIAPRNSDRFEGSTGITPYTFRVSRSGDVRSPGTVDFRVAPIGTATVNAADFGGTLPVGQISFAANQVFKDITINVTGDLTAEPDEFFNVVLSNASSGFTLGTANAIGVIRTDESALSIVATSASKPEGNSGNNPYTFTVNRSGPVSFPTSVNFAVSGAGANPANAADFGGTFPSGQVFFAANERSKVITMNVTGDTTVESNEEFAVTLSQVSSGTMISTATAVGLIIDDDSGSAPPSMAIAAISADKAEGNSGNTPFTFSVTRSGNVAVATTVNFAVTGSGTTPAVASDFAGGVFPTGQVSFAANETSKVITINVLGDAVDETNDGFTITLSAASGGATISTATASGNIRNDDTAPLPQSLAIAATSADKAEGNSGNTPFTFTVTRSGNLATATTVNFAATGSGTTPAQASDFAGGIFPSGQVSFAANENTKVITINVLGDTVVEAGEGFTVTLSSATGGATISTATAAGVIRNDDIATALAIAATSASKAEGNSGSIPFTFTVTRSGNVAGATTVNFAVTGSGATPALASDFVGGVFPTGQVAFAANETSKVITVNVLGETLSEANEGFTVTLSNASGGATITTASAVGLILNDDTALAIAATSASKAEGNSGSTPFTFTVTRSGNIAGATTVNFAVAGNGATPAQASDFTGGVFPSGQVSFAANETSKVIMVNVVGDIVAEANEGFAVTLSNASSSATITTATALGVIQNDENSISIAATSANKSEGNSGSTPFTFTVTRVGLLSSSATVNFAVSGTGATPATAADFGGTFPTGQVSFAANEASKVITINVLGELAVEANESFLVTLSGPSNGAVLTVPTATGVILNDDTSLAIAATSASKAEGNAATTPFTFTVTRTGNVAGTGTVNFAVTGTGASPATAADFGTVLPTGQVAFAANETSKVVTINVLGDRVFEANESFLVTLSSPSNSATISTPSASGLIINDDTSLSIAASSANKAEGQSSNTAFTFVVTRGGVLTGTTTVNYSVIGSGAIQATAADFGTVLPTGTVTFAPNETSKFVTINVIGDRTVETDEGFAVVLVNPSIGATLVTSRAEALIRNDDAVLAIAATSANQNEGSVFTFTVTRTGFTTGTSTVNFAVAGSGANPASAADFGGTLPSGIVTFGPGETSKVITINALSDNLTETDEGFVVVLSNASAESQILTSTASGTIREGCLTVGNLVVGDNVLTYTCGVPGTMIAFAMGSGPGSTTYAQYGVTLGLATPMIMGIGVTDANGVARIIVRLTASQLLSRIYFQAFEASPTRKVSNVVIR